MSRSDDPRADDRELVARILGGSERHFDLLYEGYFARVHRFALRRLRDPAEAEDATVEVFLTVFTSLESFTGDSPLWLWILQLTRNAVYARLRPERGSGAPPGRTSSGAWLRTRVA